MSVKRLSYIKIYGISSALSLYGLCLTVLLYPALGTLEDHQPNSNDENRTQYRIFKALLVSYVRC